jgi:hypothetical protein
MPKINIEDIEACQECGCLFHIRLATRNLAPFKDNFTKIEEEAKKVAICPACKHEYELPNK